MEKTSSKFLIGALITLFVILCILFAKYFSVFVLTMVFGLVFQPINHKLRRVLGASTASFLTVLLVVVVVFGVFGFVLVQMVKEAEQILQGLQAGTIVPHSVIVQMQAKMTELLPFAKIDILDTFKSGLLWLVSQTGNIFQSVAVIVLNLFLSIFALFYWFKDSATLRQQTLNIIPLSKTDAASILDRLTLSVHSLVKGTLVIALLQGISAGIGFFIFGVPNALLWAAVTAVCALVPTVGTTIIFVPVIAYLALSGSTLAAIGIAVWGLTAVGLLDNILGPKLMSRGSNMHPVFTLLAVLGGVHLFGIVGLFAGPLLVSLFFAVCAVYVSHKESLI